MPLRLISQFSVYAVTNAMISPQVYRPAHEYDLYLMLFITSSGGL